MVLFDFSCQQNLEVKFLSAMKIQSKNQSLTSKSGRTPKCITFINVVKLKFVVLTSKSVGRGPIMGYVMIQE